MIACRSASLGGAVAGAVDAFAAAGAPVAGQLPCSSPEREKITVWAGSGDTWEGLRPEEMPVALQRKKPAPQEQRQTTTTS